MNLAEVLLVLSQILAIIEIAQGRRPRHKRRRNRNFKQDSRPNIIFIIADDLDIALGSPEVMKKTKRLLREGGTEFENAFVTSSICCPSRSSILTGRYAHNHRVVSNRGSCGSTEWRTGPEQNSIGKLLQDAGYRTGYFGKYLNTYNGDYIPPGWSEWHGLIRNSRFYNYTLNRNGRMEQHRSNYERDYFTNVITDASLAFFRKSKIRDYKKPVMMVISHAAPHGPEDPAPQHKDLLKDAKAPRLPNFNVTSKDKHWIIRSRPHLNKNQGKFVDLLHRRRLLTLLALDDAIARVHQAIRRMRMLHNTYIFFSSDHGYHLGQFNLVKGKSHVYETDIRVPLYVIGPGVPVNKTSSEVVLNIDLLPTFLDIAGATQPDYIDGSSMLSVISAKKKSRRHYKNLPVTPWRDSFLVERSKVDRGFDERPVHQHLKSPIIYRQDPFSKLFLRLKVLGKSPTQRHAPLLCTRPYAPTAPCTSSKKWICTVVNRRFVIKKCPKRPKKKDRIKETRKANGKTCVCKSDVKEQNPTVSPQEMILTTMKPGKLAMLKKRVNILANREYYRRLAARVNLPDDQAAVFAKLLVRIQRKYRKRSLRKFTLQDVRHSELQMKIRETKKRLEALRQRKRSLKSPAADAAAGKKCTCESSANKKSRSTRKGGKRDKKKPWGGDRPKNIKCFYVHKDYWRMPPLWNGRRFMSCLNSPNNSYWCLRTINATHNFIYCRFVTNFFEYYDLNKDPYQLNNTYKTLSRPVLADLDRQLYVMKLCKGERACTLTASNTPERIIRPLIRRNFGRLRYPRGKYIDWRKYLSASS